MKYISLSLLLLGAVCIAAFKPLKALFAKQTANDEGWVELINKKDFTGWRSSETKSTWTITPEGYFQAVGKRSHLFHSLSVYLAFSKVFIH